ncbi:MAG TPA: PDZ domain-containing protein, partial [Candidatus Aminicenantes bacterium]|nr:PDZ domain-containing protein [Candidatus Aminicenantes bacterium]
MKRMVFYLLSALLALATAVSGAGKDADVKPILNRVSPSLVKVVAEDGQRYVASGIAIGGDEVLTSTIPFRQPMRRVYVVTTRGEQIEAEVVGKDWPAGMALLRLKKKTLAPIPLARGVEAGDWVALVGVFYRTFPAVYQGIVSSVTEDELLINAAIAPGAAGGAVVNRKGELVGVIRGSVGFTQAPAYTFRDHQAEIEIRAAKTGGTELCFALPLERMSRVAAELRQFGRVKRPWIGVTVTASGQRLAVAEVMPDSPAQLGGMKPGDELLACRGQAVRSPFDLGRVMQNLSPGEKVAFQIRRAGKVRTVQLRVAQSPDRDGPPRDFPRLSRIFTADNLPGLVGSLPGVDQLELSLSDSRRIGIDVVELSQELAGRFGAPGQGAVMVSRVFPGSAAGRAGVTAGDLIVQANHNAVVRHDDLRRTVSRMQEGELLHLELLRDRKSVPVSLRLDPMPPPPEEGWQALERIWNGLGQGLAEMERLKEPEPANRRPPEARPTDAERARL